MARSAKSRKARSTRKPVTIDLEAETILPEDEATSSDNMPDAEAVNLDATNADETQSADDMNHEESPSDDGEAVADGAAPQENPVKQSGNKSPIVAGIIGGVLTLVGAGGLQMVGLLPSLAPAQEQVDIAPLETRIQNLDARLQALNARDSVQVSGLSPESAQAIEDATAAATQAQESVSVVEQSVEEMSTRITSVENSITSGAAGENAGLEALTTRLTAAEAQLTELSQGDDAGSALNADIDDLKSQLAALESKLQSQSDEAANAQAALETKLEDVKSQLSETQSSIESGASNANVATAIASAGLKSAIDRGGSFMTELEAYASVAQSDETVTELRNYAASGVMTQTQLSSAFPAIANKIVAAGVGVAEDASIVDRLTASARSLVQVRPVGEVEGEGPGEIAARMEQDLQSGNLDAALAEWETLPDAAKDVSSDFANSLRARIAVDALIGSALTGAITNTAPAAGE